MLRSRDTDVVGDSSGRSYVTEQGHNVPLLRTSAIERSDGPPPPTPMIFVCELNRPSLNIFRLQRIKHLKK